MYKFQTKKLIRIIAFKSSEKKSRLVITHTAENDMVACFFLLEQPLWKTCLHYHFNYNVSSSILSHSNFIFDCLHKKSGTFAMKGCALPVAGVYDFRY